MKQPKSPHMTRSCQFLGPELVFCEMQDGSWDWLLFASDAHTDAAHQATIPEYIRYAAHIMAVN